MMKKDELKKMLILNTLINAKLKELENLKNFGSLIPSSGNIDGTKVQTSSINDSVSGYVGKIYDMEVLINRDIDVLVDLKSKAINEFKKLDLNLELLMTLRYINCLPWEVVSEEIGYSIQHCFRLHGVALEKLRRINE